MKKQNVSRRDFFKTVGAAGIASSATTLLAAETKEEKPEAPKKKGPPQVPTRKLGKTKIKVPILNLGVGFNAVDNQVAFRRCLVSGVNYWDSANSYAGGNSELGIGAFLKRKPELRKKLILTSKASGAKNIEQIEKKLQTTFKRMNTDYIDIYYGVHGMKKPDQLTEDLRQWSIEAKKRGVIKSFGFTTHTNMAECLLAASKLDWIDVIMTSYNFKLMQDKKMQEAVEACHKAGIGLVAMKVMKKNSFETDEDKLLAKQFLDKGMTPAQAKMKIVLQDKRIATACIRMETVPLINENVKAVLDGKELTAYDQMIMNEIASTCNGFCSSCRLCEKAMPQMANIPETMRYLMYHKSYGTDADRVTAKELFAQLPHNFRANLANTDFADAEKVCPNNMPVSMLMKEASQLLV